MRPTPRIVDVAAGPIRSCRCALFLVDRYETTKYIAKCKVPLLILHGERDGVMPVAMGRELARLANEPKRLVVFPNGGHSDLYLDGNEALEAVRRWIAELKRADRAARATSSAPCTGTGALQLKARAAGRLARTAETAAATAEAAAEAAGCRGPPVPLRGGRPDGRRAGPGTRLRGALPGSSPSRCALLARELAGAAHGLGLLAHTLLGGLLVIVPQLHLAEDALALHLLLERLEGLIDVVVSDLNQQAVVVLGLGLSDLDERRRGLRARRATARPEPEPHALAELLAKPG